MHYSELKEVWAEFTAPGAPFEIEEITVRGETARAYKNAPQTVRDFWLSTQAFAEREYIVYQDERIDYARAHAITASGAAWLQAQGVRPGDRVAVAMRNYPEWMLIYWACALAGVACVGMNAWWTSDEMAFALADARPKVLFADKERLERFAAIDPAPELTVVAVRAEFAGATPWAQVADFAGEPPAPTVDPDDDMCIFYTSGTTGRPKGAQLTHRGCVTNVMNMAFAAETFKHANHRGRTKTSEPAPASPIPTGLITTPLFHVTANNCLAYAATLAGGRIVLMYRWDAGEALRLIAAEQVTSMSGVPTMARELLNHPDFGSTDTSSLTTLSGGGAQVPPDLVAKIDQAPMTAQAGTGYGMTECCGIITSIYGDFFSDKPASAGPLMPTFEGKCVDDEGREVCSGETGELWVKGAAVIKGYINQPKATAESITHGWLHTGDVARLDEDGFVFLVDRKKDMILRGGENVYCAEVEAALYRHPDVTEVCVFGVPDERLGEEVAAAVLLRPGSSIDEHHLRAHVEALIARYKAPSRVLISEEPLPRNASGKFIKQPLRERLAAKEAASG